MKSYSSKEVLRILHEDGWYIHKHNGTSHIQLKHPSKFGKVTVKHPEKDIHPKTLKTILKSAGL